MTMPDAPVWPTRDRAYRRSEVTAVVGHGEDLWRRAAADLLHWRVKTKSGFRVDSLGPATVGERLRIRARVLGVTIVEPVEVVSVVTEPDRVGFAYRTLPGHPVMGEEAFILHRNPATGDVVLTIRSLTRPVPEQPWHALHPLLRVAQRVARRRYLRALR